MGYPMTYRRVVNRNRLAEGGYEADATKVEPRIANYDDLTVERQRDVWKALAEHAYKSLDEHRIARNYLLGDLRRLEVDTVDESATALHIAQRLGPDVDTGLVAAVLKEFMSW